jgi:BirA family biotin operon repressor/biotin-[acetyl-CoA-carboxylase] ligase
MENSLDVNRLKSAIKQFSVFSDLYYFPSTLSTMDEAKKLISTDVNYDGIVIVTEEQLLGRGRFDRKWYDEPYKDLLFSIIFTPLISHINFLNMAISVALVRTFRRKTGCSVNIKWPNDIQCEGKKIAGVLCENDIKSIDGCIVIIGVGINVNSKPKETEAILQPVDSLMALVNHPFERTLLLIDLLNELDQLYIAIRNGESIVEEWRKYINTIGNDVVVTIPGSDIKTINGRAVDIDNSGNLLISTIDGAVHCVTAGEVSIKEV